MWAGVCPFNYTYTVQCCNVMALLVTLTPIRQVHILVCWCICACFAVKKAEQNGRIRSLCAFDRTSEGRLMLLLSEDEVYTGCQSLWQEE